jgi:hypothetical protein
MSHVRCPECGSPAQITDRFQLGSTSGPLEHVKIMCPQRHWFTLLRAEVESAGVAPAASLEPAA